MAASWLFAFTLGGNRDAGLQNERSECWCNESPWGAVCPAGRVQTLVGLEGQTWIHAHRAIPVSSLTADGTRGAAKSCAVGRGGVAGGQI